MFDPSPLQIVDVLNGWSLTFEYQGGSFTEIFQNQKLKVKIWHFLKPCHHSILKDTAVSFEHIHTLAKINPTNFLSPDLKLHNKVKVGF